jgi:restriction endonuclease S subunit
MLILRAQSENIFPHFLFHLLKSKQMQDEFKNSASGSAQPQLPIFLLKEITSVALLKKIVL